MSGEGRWRVWTGWILAILISALFLMSAVMKLSRGPQVLEGFRHLGWPDSLAVPIGILELACVVVYLIPPTAVLGGILLTGYLGGAIATHVRLGEPIHTHIALGIVIWGALYLRERGLRELLPMKASEFHYEREIVIDKPLGVVFSYLKMLKNFASWNPFLKKDPAVVTEYRGTDGEPGFVSSWSGNRNVGKGEQEIVRVIPGKLIEFELRFTAPFRATNQAYFAVEAITESQTRVKWGMKGRNAFPGSLFALVMNMEKMIGREFEAGLADLKKVVD